MKTYFYGALDSKEKRRAKLVDLPLGKKIEKMNAMRERLDQVRKFKKV